MKKLILFLLATISLTACATKQVQEPKYYSIEEFLQEYIATQQVEEIIQPEDSL